MLVLLIVLIAVAVLAVALAFGGFGGGYGPGAGPTVYRRIIYRRPARRVVTERRMMDDPGVPPYDDPVYRP